VKKCKFFRDGTECPYDEIGCKFKHSDDNITEELEKSMQVDDNLCYYCNTMFGNQDILVEHMTNMHMDQFANYQPDPSY
jgi:hypothetical protein